MSASLVGSEMCIRDSARGTTSTDGFALTPQRRGFVSVVARWLALGQGRLCLLYTSDAADDM
eukprot:13500789-Alexandrium_andersonii.AAC.1